jgi:mannose-6-phosphate isomerase
VDPGALPPLKFTPLIRPAPWGGRRLESMFRKVLPPQVPCGESWEVVDLPQNQSVVAEGPLSSVPLADLVRTRGEELLGEAPLLQGRFPVLFKLIDARETLSVQVHPDEEAAARVGQGARPKTEAWYVVHADRGARVYLGLRPGVGLSELRSGLAAGRVGALLHPVDVTAGDFIYLPAGTLHAIGGGVLLAEIQQASDTTFRLFDWNRVGLDGRTRPLHVEEALASLHLDLRGRPAYASPLSGRAGVRCRAFSFERVGLAPEGGAPLEAGRPRILCCVEGSGVVQETGGARVELLPGDTCLMPGASAGLLTAAAGGTFLLIRV